MGKGGLFKGGKVHGERMKGEINKMEGRGKSLQMIRGEGEKRGANN